MKKFLGILAIAGALVACNNSGSGTSTSDSTRIADSLKNVTTTTTVDTSNKMTTPPDTTKSKMTTTTTTKTDTTKKKK